MLNFNPNTLIVASLKAANLKIKSRSTQRVLLLLGSLYGVLLVGVGCVSINPNRKPINEAVFRGSMDQVWMATEKTLANYPISESNRDSGVLTTDFLRGPQCWQSPVEVEKYSAGVRCSLTLQLIKIPHNGIRVRVNKSLQMMRDFISEPEDMDNNGMEEMMILYRIDRELTVAKEVLAHH